MLKERAREFLEFLKFNRNVSPHTLRAYTTDLEQFVEHVAASRGIKPSQVTAESFDTDRVRGFLGDLHDRDLSRASSARHLAALRTFARYLVREGVLREDPTGLVGAPRKQQILPAHLATSEMERLLAAPDVSAKR